MLTLRKKAARQEQPRPQAKPSVAGQAVQANTGHEDEIRPLAYRKWEEAGCPGGDGVEFWLAAEAEIDSRIVH
jgi:hypothetical protein